MSNRSLMFFLVAIVSVGCGGGSPVFTPPPPGLGDTVVVPSDVQPEFDALVTAGVLPELPDDVAMRTLQQRRALGLYIYSNRQLLSSDELHLLSLTEDKTKAVDSIREFGAELGVLSDIKMTETRMGGSEGWHFTLYLDELRTRGELAWYGDWIMQNYGGVFLIAWPGPSNLPG